MRPAPADTAPAAAAPRTGAYLGRDARGDGLRVICFHHAGGGASGFRSWRGAFGPDVGVWPVQLPGRESRRSERPFTDIDALVTDIDRELDTALSEPHLLFGHSMGALVAYRLALRRLHRGARPALGLAAACYPAPTAPGGIGTWAGADDAALTDLLAGAGGIPAELLAHRSLLSALLEVLRADLRVCATHRPDDAAALDIPVHVFGGRDDVLVTGEALSEWRRCTAGPFSLRMLDGGHFFPTGAPRELLAALSAVVARARSRS
ncbi:thioesterase II family protein [Streptomonospora salina]|uniref:Surfactin synthase thioesterase subunit n=1 Tax=Streptomonospora salina TaxID=104205 RepID=A0A841ECY9_9ACTN|nr:alpha/beta fold hydrolase [Streptomonospora salina]MBB6001005.1 surfactin synthase thioesterase subunit [Streptomonospora salina]